MNCIKRLYRKETGPNSDRESAFFIWNVYRGCTEKRKAPIMTRSLPSLYELYIECVQKDKGTDSDKESASFI